MGTQEGTGAWQLPRDRLAMRWILVGASCLATAIVAFALLMGRVGVEDSAGPNNGCVSDATAMYGSEAANPGDMMHEQWVQYTWACTRVVEQAQGTDSDRDSEAAQLPTSEPVTATPAAPSASTEASPQWTPDFTTGYATGERVTADVPPLPALWVQAADGSTELEQCFAAMLDGLPRLKGGEISGVRSDYKDAPTLVRSMEETIELVPATGEHATRKWLNAPADESEAGFDEPRALVGQVCIGWLGW